MVNSLVLLFDEGNKVLGLVIKLELVYESLKELPYLGDEHKDYAHNDQVEQCKLNDQEEAVDEEEEHNEL